MTYCSGVASGVCLFAGIDRSASVKKFSGRFWSVLGAVKEVGAIWKGVFVSGSARDTPTRLRFDDLRTPYVYILYLKIS